VRLGRLPQEHAMLARDTALEYCRLRGTQKSGAQMTALSTGHSRGIRCGGGCKWITHSSRKQLEARERAAAPTTPCGCGLNTKSKRLSRSAVRRQSGFRRQIFLTEVPCKARRRSWPSQLELERGLSSFLSPSSIFSLSLSGGCCMWMSG
jgi:hypothetical protein